MTKIAYTITHFSSKTEMGHLKPPSEDKEWELLSVQYVTYPDGGGKIFATWVERPASNLLEQLDRMRRREIYTPEPDF